jgi:T-complex protein 1 subunit theta
VVLRNIEACLQLSRMLSSSVGPQGRCKLVVNNLQKTIVTSDCASMLKEVDVIHPAAQLIKQAVEKQQEEYGDNTAFALAFGG